MTSGARDDLPRRVRKFVYDRFLEFAAPPVVEQVMTEFSLSRETASGVLRDLDAARHLALVKGTARILMAFPFSAIATPFAVTVGGRRYFANCAWDAITFHAMLGSEVQVESFCHHCAKPIRVAMRGGRAVYVEPKDVLVYLALPPRQWWDDIINTCSNAMVFFASADHRDDSALCASPDLGASLTPDQMHALSVPLYSPRMSVDYARPSKDARWPTLRPWA